MNYANCRWVNPDDDYDQDTQQYLKPAPKVEE